MVRSCSKVPPSIWYYPACPHQSYRLLARCCWSSSPPTKHLYFSRRPYSRRGRLYLLAVYYFAEFLGSPTLADAALMCVSLVVSIFIYEIGYPLIVFTPLILCCKRGQFDFRDGSCACFAWYIAQSDAALHRVDAGERPHLSNMGPPEQRHQTRNPSLSRWACRLECLSPALPSRLAQLVTLLLADATFALWPRF